MIGPASNFVLSQIDVMTPLGELDKLNSPGLLMAASWALYSLVVFLLYTDLDTIQVQSRLLEEMEAEEDSERQTSVLRHSVSREGSRRLRPQEDEATLTASSPLLRYTEVNSFKQDNLISSDIRDIQSQDLSQYNASQRNPVKLSDVPSLSYGSLEVRGRGSPSRRVMRSNSTTSRKSNILFGDAERMMGECSSESDPEYSEIDDTESLIHEDIGDADPGCDSDNNNTSDSSDNSPHLTTKDYIRELTREPIICLTWLRFVALFCQTSLEAIVPPVMQTYFDYGDQENSVLYLLAGMELILVFVVLNLSSRCLSDRVLISAGLLLMLTAMTWLTASLPRFKPSDRSNIPYFAVGVILDLAGIPTVCDIGLSLYSKLLPSNMQVCA